MIWSASGETEKLWSRRVCKGDGITNKRCLCLLEAGGAYFYFVANNQNNLASCLKIIRDCGKIPYKGNL